MAASSVSLCERASDVAPEARASTSGSLTVISTIFGRFTIGEPQGQYRRFVKSRENYFPAMDWL